MYQNPMNFLSQKLAQSALPNTRKSRKRKAEVPMTSSIIKKSKTNVNNNRFLDRCPITKFAQESNEEYKTESENLDLSGLQLNFDRVEPLNINTTDTEIDDIKSNEQQQQDMIMINKSYLLSSIKRGIPARYDILPLSHSIMNLDENTEYFRSSKMQKLFESVYMGHELHCVVRTSDDFYGLNENDTQQIENNVSEWVHKYGEYSSNLHASIHEIDGNKLETNNHIFQYEVLGRFIGDEMIENEFPEVCCCWVCLFF